MVHLNFRLKSSIRKRRNVPLSIKTKRIFPQIQRGERSLWKCQCCQADVFCESSPEVTSIRAEEIVAAVPPLLTSEHTTYLWQQQTENSPQNILGRFSHLSVYGWIVSCTSKMMYFLISPPQPFPILMPPLYNRNPRSDWLDPSPCFSSPYLLLQSSAASHTNPALPFTMLISYKCPVTNIFQVLHSTPKAAFFFFVQPSSSLLPPY